MYADISSVKFPTHRGDSNFHFSSSQIRFTSRISLSDILICVMIHINSTLTKAERDDEKQHIALHNQLNSRISANDDTPSEAEIFTAYQFHSEHPKLLRETFASMATVYFRRLEIVLLTFTTLQDSSRIQTL